MTDTFDRMKAQKDAITEEQAAVKLANLSKAMWEDAEAESRDLRRALFMCAAHCQGGHSEAGQTAAALLDVPFPIRMESLVPAAQRAGFDPDELWPWLKSQQANRPASASPDFGDKGS